MTTTSRTTPEFLESEAIDGSTNCDENNKKFSILAEALTHIAAQFSTRLAATLTAFGISLMLVLQSAHAANLVDTFTYTGTETGFTANTVYTLVVNGNTLNVCKFTPSGSAPYLTYSPSCIPGISPQDNSGYTSIAYLGTVNNPNNYFAVGDGAGTIALMQIQFNDDNSDPIAVNQIYSYSLNDPDTGSPCSTISSMAVDPNGKWLYVACGINDSDFHWKSANYSTYVYLKKVILGVAPIGTDGQLGTITVVPPALPSGAGSLVLDFNNTPTRATGAAWLAGNYDNSEVIWPQLREYPAGYPTFTNSESYSGGAVLFSGFINGIMQPKKGASNIQPVNSGLLCSDGACQFSYNIILAGSDSFSVMTAAEYAADQNGNPVLWWNQVQGGLFNSSSIIAAKSSNSVVAYSLPSQIVNGAVVNNPSPTSTLNQSDWSSKMPDTIWVSQLLYLPEPAAFINNPDPDFSTSYVSGLLVMATRNNGYLAYYDISGNTYQPEVFFSGNSVNGEIGGNPYGLTSDTNGNLLMVAGGSIFRSATYGLLGLNPFAPTNIETQESVTYIPIPSDTNGGNNCGTACDVIQGLGIVSDLVTTIGAVTSTHQTAVASPSASKLFLRQRTDKPTMSGAAFERPLGKNAYWGQFTYSQQQVQSMGVKPGSLIRGLRFRIAGGIGPEPAENIKLNRLQVGFTRSPDRFTVFNGTFCVAKHSYDRNFDDGYGPTVWFNTPYYYSGGDLTVTFRHSGSGSSKRLYLDGIKAAGVGGWYSELASMWSIPRRVVKTAAAPAVKLITGIRPSTLPPICN